MQYRKTVYFMFERNDEINFLIVIFAYRNIKSLKTNLYALSLPSHHKVIFIFWEPFSGPDLTMYFRLACNLFIRVSTDDTRNAIKSALSEAIEKKPQSLMKQLNVASVDVNFKGQFDRGQSPFDFRGCTVMDYILILHYTSGYSL